MRPTTSLLRTPLIHFVGGPHKFSPASAEVVPHVFSAGLLPGSPEAIKVSSLPKRAASSPRPQAQQYSSWTGLPKSDKEFQYTSVTQLPARFAPLAVEELEMEAVNFGGAL